MSACVFAKVEDEVLRHKDTSQRQDRQIQPFNTKSGQPHDEPCKGRAKATRNEGYPRRDGHICQKTVGIGAEGHKSTVTQGDLATNPSKDVQAYRCDQVDTAKVKN